MTEPKQDAGGEITTLLATWNGDRASMPERLVELAYPRLHQIACNLFRSERPGALLQPTGVVNELFLKLVRARDLRFEDRQRFFNLAWRLVRHILIDQARASCGRSGTGACGCR